MNCGNTRSMQCIVLILILSLAATTPAYAKSSPEFSNYLTSLLFEQCQDKDLQINKDCLKKEYKTYPGPHSRGRILELVQTIDSQSWGKYNKTWSDGCVGEAVVKCGPHVLDVNGDNYYFDGQRIETPRKTNISYENSGTLIQDSPNASITNAESSSVAIGPGGSAQNIQVGSAGIDAAIESLKTQQNINNDKAIKLLVDIKTSLQSQKPDKSSVTSKLKELDKYISPAVNDILAALVLAMLKARGL